MKTIIYIRVSHKDQVTNGSSLDNQRDRLLKYAEYKGMTVVDIIEDQGISGRTTSRSGFQKMMSMLDEIDCVVVYSISRFARSVVDTLGAIEKLRVNNVEFHSINENVDTSTAQGRFFLTVISALAEMESDQMGERIKSVMSYKKDSGLVYCGNTPYGFDSIDGKLVPNESEQRVISKIRALRSKNYSLRKVADTLNNDNIRSKSGKKFYASTIRYILDNSIHGDNTSGDDLPKKASTASA